MGLYSAHYGIFLMDNKGRKGDSKIGDLGLSTSKASLLTRIRESILTVILVTFLYENQCLSLSHTVNAAVSEKFDSWELRRK